MKKTTTFLTVVAFATLNFLFLTFNSTAQYTKLLDFNGSANGNQPLGSLISDGTFLYGMTEIGGNNSSGVIFKIKTNGTAYSKPLNFYNINGSFPI